LRLVLVQIPSPILLDFQSLKEGLEVAFAKYGTLVDQATGFVEA
jgi:hypothetical protein